MSGNVTSLGLYPRVIPGCVKVDIPVFGRLFPGLRQLFPGCDRCGLSIGNNLRFLTVSARFDR